MKFLVTGAAGFIGSHLTKALLSEGHYVVGADNFNAYYNTQLKFDRVHQFQQNPRFALKKGDLADLAFVKRMFTEDHPDAVIHLAAQAGVRYSIQNPHAYTRSNLTAFINLIEEAHQANIKKFIYASSSSVYGKNKKTPFSTSDSVDHPISLYAATKKSNELIAHVYHHLYDMDTIGLRFFTVYGPWGRPDMAYYKFTQRIMADQPIDVYNFGKDLKRDFTYIDDIIDGIKSVIKHAKGYKVYNLGNNEPVELMNFITTIEHHIGKVAKKNLLPMQPGDVHITYADITESKADLNYQPKTSIDEGIKQFTDWYRSYHA